MVQPSRNLLALSCAVMAAVATVGAVLALYLRFEVGERDAFADRTAAAFDRPEVRRVVAREVVVELIDRGSTDLVSARPVLEGVVEALVGTPPFQRLVRAAAAQSHQLLFERDDNVAGVRPGRREHGGAVRRAQRVARHRQAGARRRGRAAGRRARARLRRRHAGRGRRRPAAGAVRLPILAVLLLVGALVVAADRRRALTRYGLALGMTGIVAVVALSAGRAVVVDSIQGSDEIPRADVQAAVGGVWDAFLGDLRSLILIVALVGFVLASSILTVADPQAVRARLAALTRRPARAPLAAAARRGAGGRWASWCCCGPRTRCGCGLRGGAALVYLGSSELLRVLGSPRRAERAGPCGGCWRWPASRR